MYRLDKEDLTFKGQDEVLSRISEIKKISLIDRIRSILEMDIEIPIASVVLTCVCFVAIMNFHVEKEVVTTPNFPIVVIDSGGRYEIY